MAMIQFGNEDENPENVENVSKPVKRMRWATQRVPKAGGVRKRVSIMDRFQRQHGSKDEKRKSGATNNTADTDSATDAAAEEEETRRIWFNIPLPEEAKDEEGHPKATYVRNKIRTAKYTPLSFIPKNLWFQFHNIANIYFLFIIILSVRLSPMPLIALGWKLIFLLVLDFPNFWSRQPRSQFGPSDRNSHSDSYQRCDRGLAKNRAR